MLTFSFHADTHVGKQRTDNQDNFLCKSPIWGRKALALLAAIDGVGGYAGGEVAAQLARDTIEVYLDEYQTGERLQLLKEAITQANNRIVAERASEVRLARMSCVLSVAIADADKQLVHYGHVGDTRLYIFRDGNLQKISHDHSVVGYREETGELSEEEAMNHPQRNEILRVLGAEFHRPMDDNFIETGEVAYLPNDILLLCSDGLTDLVTKAQMEKILQRKATIHEKTQSLIEAANDAGGKDNITVVLATYQDTTVKKVVKPIAPKPMVLETQLPEPQQPIAVKEHRQPNKNWMMPLFMGLLGLVVGSAGMWFYMQPDIKTKSKSLIERVLDAKERLLFQKLMTNDTLSWTGDSTQIDTIRLSAPIMLPDNLHWLEKGKLVLIPLDSLSNKLAIQIRDTSQVTLQNIQFVGFEVGIWADEKASVLLINCFADKALHRTELLNLAPNQRWKVKTDVQKLP